MNHHHNTAKCSVGGYESKWLGIRNFVDCNIIKAKNLAFRSKLLQQVGIVAPDDDIPIVTGLSTFKVSPWKLFTKLMDGDLAELAGEPLFLLLDQFYRRFGPVYRIVFGPKSFLVITDPIAIRHILRTNAFNYNKGVLKEVLDPVMGEGLISADVDVWRAKKRVIAPGITKQWINSLVGSIK